MRTMLMAALAVAGAMGEAVPAELRMPADNQGEVVVTASSLLRDDAGGVTATGGARVVHGDLMVSCAGTIRIVSSGHFFSTLEASGAAKAKAGRKTLRAAQLEYELTRHLVTLRGDPEVVEDGTTYRAGEKILLYLETGVMKCEPRALISVDRGFQKAALKPKRRKFLGLF